MKLADMHTFLQNIYIFIQYYKTNQKGPHNVNNTSEELYNVITPERTLQFNNTPERYQSMH